jgi:nondiscriminating aspartyl-tRNA synthetase
MNKTSIAKITPGKKCKIQGFVENIRNKRTIAFIVIKDITGKIQVTIDKQSNPDLSDTINRLTLQSFVTVTGTVLVNEYVKLNGVEMIPDDIVIESLAEPLPIQDDSSIDLKMDYRWLDLRSDKNQMIYKIQTCMVDAMRKHLLKKGFIEIHTPKLIGTASESGANVFELSYFDTKAYLAQSPQFYKQMAMASGFESIFEVGPVFRAEKSYTSRHATEFTGFDLETSNISSFKDLMKLEENLLTDMLKKVKAKYGDKIKDMFGLEVIVPQKPFPVIKLPDLYAELEKRYGYRVSEEEKGDLTTDAERYAYRFSMDEYGHEFLFITDFDAKNRAFYHMRKDNVPQGYDLIWRGVEITTGAQREHRYEILKKQAEEKGLDADVRFYLEFFRYGCPPHGGFGIGIDRLTMLLLGLHIKDSMFIFRGPNRLFP